MYPLNLSYMEETTILNSNSTLKDKMSERFLLFFIVIEAFLSYSNSSFATVFALLMIFVFAFYNKYLALSAYIGTVIISPGFSTVELFIVLSEISVIGASIMNFKCRAITNYFIITTVFFLLMIIGMALGTKTEMVSILLFVINLYVAVFVAQAVVGNNEKLIVDSLLFAGLMIAIQVGYSYLTGNIDKVVSASGRLLYQENSKNLATIIVIPCFIALYKLLDIESRRKKGKLVFYVACFAICFPVLLLTYSRGVTIALIVAAFLLMVIQPKALKFYSILMYSLVAVAIYFIISHLTMDSDLWFNNLEGGNGRTDIYKLYFDYMFRQGGRTIVFGYGTSNMGEVIGWYPHSVILSYFFNLGIIGVLYLLYEITASAMGLIKQGKNARFYIGLLVLGLMMFSSHGTYNTALFCLIIGLCFGMANNKQIG